jgi:hypothetical protein
MSAPFFIVGTERSGSNLLRVILDAHPALAVPHPPHILRYFAPLERRYGDLEEEENLQRLVRDVLRLLRVHIHPWPISLDAESLVAAADPRDLYGVFTAIYEAYLVQAGANRWGCKSTFMIHHTDRIFARHPGAKLLWLVRDPRDVAASSRKSVFSPFHPLFTARLWAEQQSLGLKLEADLGAEVLFRVRYEDLLADPDRVLRGVCSFLGEPFDAGMLRFFETEAAQTGAAWSRDWENTARPILPDNTHKYRTQLSPEEIRWVERAAADPMAALGYEREYPDLEERSPRALEQAWFRVRDAGWHLAVEMRSLRTDRNHWRRWGRGATMAALDVSTRWMG